MARGCYAHRAKAPLLPASRNSSVVRFLLLFTAKRSARGASSLNQMKHGTNGNNLVLLRCNSCQRLLGFLRPLSKAAIFNCVQCKKKIRDVSSKEPRQRLLSTTKDIVQHFLRPLSKKLAFFRALLNHNARYSNRH